VCRIGGDGVVIKKRNEREASQILADKERERDRQKEPFYAFFELSSFASFSPMRCMPLGHLSFLFIEHTYRLFLGLYIGSNVYISTFIHFS